MNLPSHPRFGAFIGTGAVLGVAFGLYVVLSGQFAKTLSASEQAANNYSAGTSVGYMALVFGLLGAVVGAVVAAIIATIQQRRR